jgi:putative DeoR family transcriptional regulator (stage III sporulation protein D)
MSMDEDIKKRVLYTAKVILDEQSTVREVAKIIGLSKSTIHKDLTSKLIDIDKTLFEEVAELLDYNKKIRHIRGGQKTKEKYARMKSINL